jgi:steroid delta-isomerase-like uncharacterized protein
MHRDEMLSLFHQHRKAEAARDFDAIMATFGEDCYLETVPLSLRIEGRTAARAAYEGYFFTAFPDLSPDDQGFAFGDDAVVTWGTLRGTSKGEFLGVPAGGRAFEVQLVNVARFRAGRMAGESIYFDLAPSTIRVVYRLRSSGPPRRFGRKHCNRGGHDGARGGGLASAVRHRERTRALPRVQSRLDGAAAAERDRGVKSA